MSDVLDRIVSELRDERERLSIQLATINAALSKLAPDEDGVPVAPTPHKAPKARETVPKGAVQTELLQWLGEHPGSGISDVCSGLGWERGLASAALANAKRGGLVATAGGRRDMTYSVVTQ